MFTLGRDMDIHYKTNQLITGLLLLTAALGWIVTGSVVSGLYIGGSVFLTWALSREIDPKHDYSAFLAAAFSLLNLFYYENVQLLVIFWLLLLLRMINGITGKRLTAFDVFSTLGLTLYLTYTSENSIYLLPFALAAAFVLRDGEKIKVISAAGGIASALFLAASLFMDYLSVEPVSYLEPVNLFLPATSGLSLMVFWFLSKEGAEDDRGHKVSRSRLLSSQVLYSLTVLLLFFFSDMGLNNLIMYASAVWGVTISFALSKAVNTSHSG